MFRPLVTLFHGLNVAVSSGGAADDDDAADAAAAPAPPTQQQLSDPSASPATGITGLDVCARKPVFVTCGADRTVRLWSYSTAITGLLQDGGGGGGGAAAGAITAASKGIAGGGAGGSLAGGDDYLTPTLELVQVRGSAGDRGALGTVMAWV